MCQPETESEPAPTRAATPVMTRPRFPAWLMAVLLVLVTMALYWPATRCDFVTLDDNTYVIDNTHVSSGLTFANVWWALGSGYAANWHPVTWLSHMLDCQMFGLKPWGHHLTSVLLHALNAGLVFALLQLMTGARWRSLVVAALFAVHPLRVESVAWVSERKDVLSAFFGLLALLAYARYAEGSGQKSEDRSPKTEGSPKSEAQSANPEAGGPSTLRSSATEDGCCYGGRATEDRWSLSHLPASSCYLLSLFFFALGLMSKPMLVTWPLVMLLLDYWPLRRWEPSTINSPLSTGWRLVREKIPFFALAALASVVTFLVQQHGGAVMGAEGLPLGARVGNALISYRRYLGKLFRPADLAVFYYHPGQWPLGKVLLAGGLLLSISVAVWLLRRRSPVLLVGWLWFLGTLVPVIGLVQVGEQAMADRYTYFPSLGVLLLAAWGAYELTRRWHYGVLALWVAGSAAIVLCLALTRQQIGYWKDGEALFRHALAVTENNQIVHVAFGDALGRKGQLDGAIRQYQEAIRLKPGYAHAHHNLGIALEKKGQLDEAIRQYQEAIRLKPDYAEAQYALGVVFLEKGQLDEAIPEFQGAIRLQPDYADAHNNLGLALGRKGQLDEAIRQLQEAIRLKPDYAQAHNNLGNALAMKGQLAAAISQFQAAVRLKPDYAEAHNNLGNALTMKVQLAAAISQFQAAIRLKPDYAQAHNNLGIALVGKGQMDEAIRQFQEAVKIQPDFADARKNLDLALATQARSSPPPGASTNR